MVGRVPRFKINQNRVHYGTSTRLRKKWGHLAGAPGTRMTSSAPATRPPGNRLTSREEDYNHSLTLAHTHFRVSIGKTRKPFEKNGWPEGRQACDGMKTKNKLRQARRTRSPLQHAARTGAARTGAGCREAVLRPTQRRLGRPAEEHENGRPTGK